LADYLNGRPSPAAPRARDTATAELQALTCMRDHHVEAKVAATTSSPRPERH